MIYLILIGLLVLSLGIGRNMGLHDAKRITEITTTRSLNHASRLFFRVMIGLGLALLAIPILGWNWWLLPALWLMNLAALNLSFVPTLNRSRIPPKPRYYVSPSNVYDSLLIRFFGRYAGRAGVWINVFVLMVALVWVVVVYLH